MKLSTRFGIGAALAMLPLLAVCAYSVDSLQALARANERLSERHLIGLQIGLGVVSRLERLEEYWRKYTVSQDLRYAGKFEETLLVTQRELEGILSAELSSAEEQALREFTQEFASFASIPSTQRETAPEAVFAQIRRLTTLASAVHAEARRIAKVEADNAVLVRETTQRAALVAAGAAATASLILILLTVRSLRLRLQPLVRGTHAVSKNAVGSHDRDQSALARRRARAAHGEATALAPHQHTSRSAAVQHDRRFAGAFPLAGADPLRRIGAGAHRAHANRRVGVRGARSGPRYLPDDRAELHRHSRQV